MLECLIIIVIILTCFILFVVVCYVLCVFERCPPCKGALLVILVPPLKEKNLLLAFPLSFDFHTTSAEVAIVLVFLLLIVAI